jgi:membrane-associated phospholipid phosphatase
VIDTGAFERIDEAVDGVFEPLRGREPVDRTATALSNLSDYGLIWVLLGLVKMRSKGPRRRRAFVALGAAGFSSLIASRLIKQSVERERPEDHLDANVRAPSSSSFPSGHTLAAFCTAVVLPETELGMASAVGFAAAVAASRVHLRAHHPTDVIGGAVIGSGLGLLLRPLVNVVTPGRAGRRTRSRRKNGMDGPDYLLTRL